VLIWQATTIIYNLFFHPLRKFPGPLLERASGIPWALRQIAGVQARHTQKLHERYGPVVRIGPKHLSFTDPKAWKDIYGHRVGGDINSMLILYYFFYPNQPCAIGGPTPTVWPLSDPKELPPCDTAYMWCY
jgi:hypothetical protein